MKSLFGCILVIRCPFKGVASFRKLVFQKNIESKYTRKLWEFDAFFQIRPVQRSGVSSRRECAKMLLCGIRERKLRLPREQTSELRTVFEE